MTHSGLRQGTSPETHQVTLLPRHPVLKRQLYIAWVPFQRRAVAMEAELGYELHHIGLSLKQRSLRPLEYVIKAWQTMVLLLRRRPEVLWIQMPPAPLLYLAFFYKQLFQQELTIIADCHNATFRRPWIQFPGVVSLFNRCQSIVVHNPDVEDQAIALGLEASRLAVLRDRTLRLDEVELSPEPIAYSDPWVLVPCSFNADEPIAELLQAARLAPEITFVLTGNVNRAQGRHCLDEIPENLKLAGFVSESRFNALLAQANAIVGLTKLDGIQLSVANEALSYGQPMVLSNTKLLQSFFPKGAVYVDPLDAEAIALGCRRAIEFAAPLRQAVQELKQDVDEQWQQQALPIRALLTQS